MKNFILFLLSCKYMACNSFVFAYDALPAGKSHIFSRVSWYSFFFLCAHYEQTYILKFCMSSLANSSSKLSNVFRWLFSSSYPVQYVCILFQLSLPVVNFQFEHLHSMPSQLKLIGKMVETVLRTLEGIPHRTQLGYVAKVNVNQATKRNSHFLLDFS